MSRSQPNEVIPHPCTRWMEWNGSNGNIKYYDKETKANVEVPLPFQFILLDRLSTIKGWHDASESGIFANEVRDTRKETFLVKAYKMAEPIAEGFYTNIRDRVKAEGGRYVTNLYIAYGEGGELAIGSLQFRGAALRAWMDFSNDKTVKPNLFKRGIQITKSDQGKKGSITFKTPVFELVDIPADHDLQAMALDVILQQYLASYFGKARHEQITTDEPENRTDYSPEYNQVRPDEDEIPF